MPGGNGCQRQGSFELRKCCIPVIPALGRLKQGDFNFEATEQEFVSKIRETEGREEREDRNLGRWFSGKEHPCKLKAQHPWKSQARSWALQCRRGQRREDCWPQPSTRVSQRSCLKGIKWKVIAQSPQGPPVPLPCVHMCSKMRAGQSGKVPQRDQGDGINAISVQ